MKLLVKFPTRGRRNKFLFVLKRYYDLLSGNNDVRFIITMDEDDVEMNDPLVRELLDNYPNLTYYYGNSKTKIEAVNADIPSDNWDIILLASDDMIPHLKGYDSDIINYMRKLYPDTDGVLHFPDGFQNEVLNTLSIMGRKYYDRFGYIYYPGYKSVFCDNEFMCVSRILNKVTYVDKLIIRHEHPDYGFSPGDHIHSENLKNLNHDNNLFLIRQKNNFNLITTL